MKRVISYGFELQGSNTTLMINSVILVSLFVSYLFSKNESFIYALLGFSISVLLFNLRFAKWVG